MAPHTSPEQPRGDSLVVAGSGVPALRHVAGRGIVILHIFETRGDVPDGGYNRRVECDREGLREVAQEAIDYARQHNLTLQVYDPHVWQDIEDGILGAEDLDVKWMGDPIWVRR